MRVFAYLDPGSGSVLLQALLGGVAAVLVSVKMFGKRVFRTLMFWKRDDERGGRSPLPTTHAPRSTRRRRSRSKPVGLERPDRSQIVVEAARVEPGSFRDRDSRVVVAPDAVYRALSGTGAEDWRALAGSPLLERLQSEGSLIGTEEVGADALGDAAAEILPEGTETVLRHERLPFVSYPYEWTFGMLRDAAAAAARPQLAALDEGLTLKDATPYNVQFRGSDPVFIDVGSFERLREGEPWAGYRQFCMLFLYPLLLQAYKDIPFQPWLRGSIDGITPTEAAPHVHASRPLPPRRAHPRRPARPPRAPLRGPRGRRGQGGAQKANFKPELIKANVQRLRKLVAQALLEGRRHRLDQLPHRMHLQRRRRGAQGRLRQRGRRVGAARADLGHGLQRRRLLADRRRAAPTTWSPSTTTTPPSTRSTARCATRTSAASCPWWRTSPIPRRASAGGGWSAGRSRSAARRTWSSRWPWSTTSRSPPTSRWPSSSTGCASSAATVVIEFPKREDPMVRRLLSGKREGSNADYQLRDLRAAAERALRRRALRGAALGRPRPLPRPPEGLRWPPTRRSQRRAPTGRGACAETLSGDSLRELLLGGAHLGALWAFAFVQPLLDLLGKNPDFWVARSNTAGDILIFSIGFTLLPPLVLLRGRGGGEADRATRPTGSCTWCWWRCSSPSSWSRSRSGSSPARPG